MTTEEMWSAWSLVKGSQRSKFDSVYCTVKKLKLMDINIPSLKSRKIIKHAFPKAGKKNVQNYKK